MTNPSNTSKQSNETRSPLRTGTGIETVGEGLWVLHGQGQSFVADTSEGLVIIDAGPGGAVTQSMITALRTVSQRVVHAVCFSHGHLGYNAGIPQWLEHASERGEPVPRLVAHKNLVRRHDRYRETQPLQHRMAEIQFRRPTGFFKNRLGMHEPTEVFDLKLVIGSDEQRIELIWAPSETDDSIAVWCPRQCVLYGGAAVIDSIPNIGTPFRTLRDTVRWASTLEALAALAPTRVVREFGPSIDGVDQVNQVLLHTARALRWVRDEVVGLMNEGFNEREVLARIRFPDELFGTPWMRPTYGDPTYIARDIYRSENGWWDRNPTSLHPEAPEAVGVAIANAITDKRAVLEQAQHLADDGQLQLALHVVDLLATAIGSDPEIAEAKALKAVWLRIRATQVPSYVSRSLYFASAEIIEEGGHRLGIG